MKSRPHISQVSHTVIDTTMVAATRFVLAFSALLIIVIEPTEPAWLVDETRAVLVLYTLYAVYVLVSIQIEAPLPRIIQHHSWWIDTVSYFVLISLSSGTNSIFFFFFFFAVLTAAFARGFRTGFAVVLVSAVGFSTIALFTTPAETGFNLGRFLVRPLSLLVLGYMMSRWGGYENRSVRRLELLRQIGTVSNPRFGIDRTITVNLDLIRAFYDADAGLFVVKDSASDTLYAYHSEGIHSSQYPNVLRADSAFGAKLLSPDENLAAVYSHLSLRLGRRQRLSAFDCAKHEFVETEFEPMVELSKTLDARSLLTTPIYFRKQPIGRVFIYSAKTDVFDISDIAFLLQSIDYFIPIVENIRLVDQMATDAAEQERKKIARDIHDSIIQPYIGLRIGIDSLRHYTGQAHDGGIRDEQLYHRVDRLKQIADQGIEDLRNYVHGLSEASARRTAFRDSLRRFAEKFTSGTGIDVELNYASDLSIRDRLAAEVFQIVAEAMSNVRKHTCADIVTVNLSSVDGHLVLEIANRNDGGDGYSEFMPRSIAARTDSLGGECRVFHSDGVTNVTVSIPM
jgi:signal transduction histidine kinase